MRHLHTLAELAALDQPVHLAIGMFDGVHLGHQQVIAAAVAGARATGGAAVVLTFDPHPACILRPDQAPRLLTATPHKLRLLAPLGADACLVLNFNRQLAETSAEEFVAQLAASGRLRQICVGARFHFGHHRAGNARLLAALASRHGYVATEIAPVTMPDGEALSSSAIRLHVQQGRLGRAAAMLGRPVTLWGVVARGDQRGRTIGFPTANLQLQNEILPPDGVYAAWVRWGAERRRGVVNIGVRPTFAEATPGRLVEIHLLDWQGDLYGQELEVELHRQLRGEQKFASVPALQEQIRRDIESARQLLSV